MTAFPCSTASYHRKAEARLPAQSTPKLLRELRSLDFARFYGACTPPLRPIPTPSSDSTQQDPIQFTPSFLIRKNSPDLLPLLAHTTSATNMMRLSTSGALRAGLSHASRQATTTTTLISRAAASTTAPANHAISNPTLANIEKRWEGMPLQEQAELWMALRDRMKENWSNLTFQEKKAGESAREPRQLRTYNSKAFYAAHRAQLALPASCLSDVVPFVTSIG